MVTGDVTALYTNMQIPRSIRKVRELFARFPSNLRPDQEILDPLEICLTTNEFEFDGKLFVQILGTAMGKAIAPLCHNLPLCNQMYTIVLCAWYVTQNICATFRTDLISDTKYAFGD